MTILNQTFKSLIQLLIHFKFHNGFPILHCFLFLLSLPIKPTMAQFIAPPPPNPFSPIRFNNSMAIIMVILVVTFFILGFLSVYTRQCAEGRIRGRPDLALGGGGSGGQSRRGTQGLEPAVINTFPTFVYSTVKGLKIGKGSLECAVCLNEFEDDETLRFIPKCNHVFHCDCIDVWLGAHVTCPVCRANLIPKPGDHTSLIAVEILESETAASVQPNPRSATDADPELNHSTDMASPKVSVLNHSPSVNRSRPSRSRSTRSHLSSLFPRSNSTGHSVVQPGENCDRFTLRLPEEVRTELLHSTLNRTKSCVGFTRLSSGRRGYRSGSENKDLYTERSSREGRPDRGRFTRTISFSFFGRSGSSRLSRGLSGRQRPRFVSSNVAGEGDDSQGSSDPLWPEKANEV